MSIASPEEVRAQAVAELKRRQLQERSDLESIYNWYGLSCPCNLPLGTCRKHPRARIKQRPPGTPGSPWGSHRQWLVFLIQAGRGGGKTIASAQFLRWKIERGDWKEVIVAGATIGEVIKYQVKGPSGLLSISPPWFRPTYYPSRSTVEYPNGAICYLATSEEPNSLRGGNIDGAWSDETGKWKYQQEMWNQIEWVLRNLTPGGDPPQNVVSTTPTPTSVIMALNDEADREDKEPGSTGVIRIQWDTRENEANLDPIRLKKQVAKWDGSLTGQQELGGELIRRRPGALWEPADFAWDGFHVDSVAREDLEYIGVAVDPSAGSDDESRASETGIIVGGRYASSPGEILSRGVILADRSCGGDPGEWGKAVVRAYHDFSANHIIAEKNQGGEMVRHVIQTVPAEDGYPSGKDVPVELVHASLGKVARAEPVAALYKSARRMRHLQGSTDALERQMIQFIAGKSGQKLDRVDALVWFAAKSLIAFDDVIDPGPIIVGAYDSGKYQNQADPRLWNF